MMNWVILVWAVCTGISFVILFLLQDASKGRLFNRWQLAMAVVLAVVLGPVVLISLFIARALRGRKCG